METFTSKNGEITWNVILQEARPTKNGNRGHFTATCSKCGHQVTGEKGNIRSRAKCPGCSPKPLALKTDDAGNCLTVCDIGTVEFVREYQQNHNVSERAAVRAFVETAKAHLADDDPIAEKLTEESVNAKIRRETGKKKDKAKHCGGPPQNSPPQGKEGNPPPVAKLHVIHNGVVYDGPRYGNMAIAQLERISPEDPTREDTLNRVIDWCKNQKISDQGVLELKKVK